MDSPPRPEGQFLMPSVPVSDSGNGFIQFIGDWINHNDPNEDDTEVNRAELRALMPSCTLTEVPKKED